MTDMEQKVAKMHHMVNDLYNKNKKLGSFLLSLDQNPNHQDIIVKGKELSKEMKHWDQEMVQRLSKAYDDLENFENKFAANYMFLMNATESEIPRVNQGSKDEKKRMDMLWTKLQAKGEEFLQIKLPQFNQLVCEKGLGGI